MSRKPLVATLASACAALLLSSGTPSGAQEETPSVPAQKVAETQPKPGVAELVPNAMEVAGKLAALREGLAAAYDTAGAQAKLAAQAERVEHLAKSLASSKAAGQYGYDELASLEADLGRESEALGEVTEPLSKVLARLAGAQREWTAERERWDRWKDSMAGDPSAEALMPAIEEARTTCETALGLLAAALKPLLEVQRRGGEIQARIQALRAETEALVRAVRGELYRKSSESMLSPEFARRFRPEIWTEVLRGVRTVKWPDPEFFGARGWAIVVHLLGFAALCAAFLRRKSQMRESTRWRFLGERPLAGAAFLTTAACWPLYAPVPASWRFVLWVITAAAGARLLAGSFALRWSQRFVYVLLFLALLSEFFRLLSLPLPLFRIYRALVGAGGSPLCLWRAAVNVREGRAWWRVWGLRAAAAVFALVFLAELAGYSAFAEHLLDALVQTVFACFLGFLLAVLLRGGVGLALGGSSVLLRFSPVKRNARRVERTLGRWVDVGVGALVLGTVLTAWRVYSNPVEALEGILSLGFTIVGYRVTVGVVVVAAAVLYGTVLVSRTLQDLLMGEVYPRGRMSWGVRISMNRLLHYVLVSFGILMALGVLGVDLQKITILAGALGVGIGFGLQNVVNNFVSGLILLFERPIKVGDTIQLDGEWGTIAKLGLRATVVRTFDQSEVIVPNSDLVSGRVVNWTFSNRISRIRVPVGVAYGSDVSLVKQILLAVAKDHPEVLDDPEPLALFLEFGDSALLFELRVWAQDVDRRLVVLDQLNEEIDRRFREAQIVIPFPQRDLHMRTVEARAEEALPAPAQPAAIAGEGRAAGNPET